MSAAVQAIVEAVWRMEGARIIGALARLLRDVGVAEELAQDAVVEALERWPVTSVPDNPAAWLMAVAKNRALDYLRHHKLEQTKQGELTYEIEMLLQDATPDPAALAAAALDDNFGDDVLRLMFVACHPVLATEARVALTLRLLGGLSTDEIARAFLVPEATIAQRIVRAKRSLAAAEVPFEVPRADQLGARLASVLQVIYLIYNEGYSASAGSDWLRPAVCDEALRLGRILAGLMPAEPEVHGLLALMEIQSSRTRARLGPDGEPVLLMEQDRSRWDRLQIARGLAALQRASALCQGQNQAQSQGQGHSQNQAQSQGQSHSQRQGQGLGPYAMQAAIAACHARALTPQATDWVRIAALYDALAELSPSPVVELNRAVAVSMAYGPQAGLALVDALQDAPALRQYHLLPSVRGDLLWRLGRLAEAGAEFRRAAAMTQNHREQVLLEQRARACVG